MWRQLSLPNGLLFEVELVKEDAKRFRARAFGPRKEGKVPETPAAEATGGGFDAAEQAVTKALYDRFF